MSGLKGLFINIFYSCITLKSVCNFQRVFSAELERISGCSRKRRRGSDFKALGL